MREKAMCILSCNSRGTKERSMDMYQSIEYHVEAKIGGFRLCFHFVRLKFMCILRASLFIIIAWFQSFHCSAVICLSA